jgi:hypothetical protein
VPQEYSAKERVGQPHTADGFETKKKGSGPYVPGPVLSSVVQKANFKPN